MIGYLGDGLRIWCVVLASLLASSSRRCSYKFKGPPSRQPENSQNHRRDTLSHEATVNLITIVEAVRNPTTTQRSLSQLVIAGGRNDLGRASSSSLDRHMKLMMRSAGSLENLKSRRACTRSVLSIEASSIMLDLPPPVLLIITVGNSCFWGESAGELTEVVYGV